MGNQNINYSFSIPQQVVSLKEFDFQTPDYAKQASSPSGMVQRMVTVGAMMFTLTICSTSSAMEKEPKIIFNTQPCTETMEKVLADLQKDAMLVEESKRESWKVETMALAKLTENWDGEGAQRVSTTAINNVLNLLNHTSVRVDLLQDIYANPNGTVSVEWENDCHEYAGVQIGRKQMSYYVTRHKGSDYCNFELINEKSYQKLLTKLAML